MGRRGFLGGALLAAVAGCRPASRLQAAPAESPGATSPAGPADRVSPAVTSEPAGPPPAEVTHGPRTGSRIALTFHGAGAPRLATELLAAAEGAGAPVTVFAVGSWLEANPRLAGRILDAGHELGNHTYSHPVLPRLGKAAAYDEIVRCADVLRKLTGSPGRWFRPSGTPHATPLIVAQARRAGYPTCASYDVDPRDYTDPGGVAVATRVLAAARPGSIVSLHLGHLDTVAALPRILHGLRRTGLRPVTMSELLQ